jgi:hypothetical protein
MLTQRARLHSWSAALPQALLLAALLMSCRNDFSSFRFAETEPSRVREASAPDDSALDAFVAANNDAASDRTVAIVGSDAAASVAAAGAAANDASPANTAPIAAPDAGPAMADSSPPLSDAMADANVGVPPETLQCTNAWNAAHLPGTACRGCACDACVGTVLSCLTSGTPQDRAACAAVYACALQHHCHDWDCYCTSSRCAMPSEPGDGPCATEIALAAGGHDHVSAVHRDNNPTQPLVKAVRAIGCSIGVPRGSVGGLVIAQCLAECNP